MQVHRKQTRVIGRGWRVGVLACWWGCGLRLDFTTRLCPETIVPVGIKGLGLLVLKEGFAESAFRRNGVISLIGVHSETAHNRRDSVRGSELVGKRGKGWEKRGCNCHLHGKWDSPIHEIARELVHILGCGRTGWWEEQGGLTGAEWLAPSPVEERRALRYTMPNVSCKFTSNCIW